MVDLDYLEQLRANAADIRADLEERERLLEENPQAVHDEIIAATRPPMPAIVHKTRGFFDNDDDTNGDDTINGDNQIPPFNDDQTEVLADVLAQIRLEFQDTINDAIAPLRERVSILEGQVTTLLSLLGNNNGDNGRMFEASETVRKLKMR
jgi:hypothetical protein